MHRIIALIFCICCCVGSVLAQTPNYPKGYFRWPVDLKPEIVANLGELRPNHWHMGLDVRTNARENQRVYAAAEGYIAYVGIRPLSFGRFIIINHPNGLSTLYGHLNDFAPALEQYVTNQQYGQQSWAVELEIPSSKFPVNKGSFIAYSGTTGGSQGPHVHFEIRDTKSGKCLNPLLFGFPLMDKMPPSIVKLVLYDRTRGSYNAAPKFFALKKTESGYILPNNVIMKTGLSKISFGIQTFDRMTGSNNQDGIYKATLLVDDRPEIDFTVDSISYEQTGYLNAHIDYPFRYNGGAYIQHLSQLPGDHGGVYHPLNSDGVIDLMDTAVHRVRVEVRDAYQNESVLDFQVQYEQGNPANAFAAGNAPLFYPNQVNVLEKPDFELYMPETCIYDTVRSFYYRSNSAAADAVSAIHQVNEPSIPVQGNFSVRIGPDRNIPEAWRDKLLIQRSYRSGQNNRKAVYQVNGEKTWLSAEFSDFGMFRAFVDQEPPTINELGRGDTIDLSPSKRILFTPADNFGIKSFRAELDGQWLRFTNDKGRNWIYRFDERCPNGIHELRVTVEDIVGNKTVKSWWFKKYPYTPPKKKLTKKKPVKKKAGTTTRKTTSTKKKSTKRK